MKPTKATQENTTEDNYGFDTLPSVLVVSDIDQAEAPYSQLLGMPGQRISPSRSQELLLSSSQRFPCVSDLSGTGQSSAGWGEKQLRGLVKPFGSLAFFVQQIANRSPNPSSDYADCQTEWNLCSIYARGQGNNNWACETYCCAYQDTISDILFCFDLAHFGFRNLQSASSRGNDGQIVGP